MNGINAMSVAGEFSGDIVKYGWQGQNTILRRLSVLLLSCQ
jgi:hypothetical protein